MSTRARVGIKNEDGTIRSIYTHWDGYPSNNGKILVKSYDTPAKINKLMDFGDCSVLDHTLVFEGVDPVTHESKGCEFYKRDRGETGTDAIIHSGYDDFKDYAEEWVYLFKDGKWYAMGWDIKVLTELKDEILEIG